MKFPSGYDDPESTHELFIVSSPERSACALTQARVAADGSRFLAPDISAAVGQAILADPSDSASRWLLVSPPMRRRPTGTRASW